MAKLSFALLWLGFSLVAGVIVFVSAGRWDLPMVWALLGILTVFGISMVILADPGLIRERQTPGPGNKDKITQPISLFLILSHWILAGLDVGRFEWSLMPLGLQVAGLIGYTLSMAVLLWAMRVNPFYSSVVRIQEERGHHPIMKGPYRFVRHPGYTASMVGAFCGGLALGSWVAMVPILLFIGLFIRRTILEDRMLQRYLAGYAEYAAKVRYRLIRGVF